MSKWRLDKSSQKPSFLLKKKTPPKKKFSNLKMNFTSKNLPSIDGFLKWRVRGTKANPGKQSREKESMGRSILIQTLGKRERKVGTKGGERHKRKWIIQCTPLVDSFVILYNGPLKNNQMIAWKRSLFSVTPSVNVKRKMELFFLPQISPESVNLVVNHRHTGGVRTPQNTAGFLRIVTVYL